ncbi:MAG TPA: glycosyltransferase [Burkholderiaceae bacterium]|nr:glycosyltransferase [Burkholderiaceae bacterium]
MKVLHLGKFDGDVGGIERHLRALLRAMPPEVEVLNLVANDHGTTDSHRRNGYGTVRVASFGSLASVALAPSLPAVARRLHRQEQFDIVHLHFPDPLGQLTAMTLPRSVRRVISWHSDIIKQKFALGFYAPLMRRFVREADALIGATPQHFSTSLQIPPGKDVQIREVISYGFDPAALAPSDDSRRKRDQILADHHGRQMVFALGRHVYYKGFDVLIRAMQGVDADLLIGGRGPLTASLQQLSDNLGISHKVTFVGFIPDPLLVAYYEACDVFCMPSVERSEQFGLVQLEAMHCSKPVVTTRLGTGVEYVTLEGETGLVVPPRDSEALARALNLLLRDNARCMRMGTAGKLRVEKVFSIEQMVTKTVDVYHRVLTAAPTAATG